MAAPRDPRSGNFRDSRNLVLVPPRSIDGVPPPADLEIEARLVGAAIYDPTLVEEATWLRPESFYGGKYRVVWGAVLRMRATGKVIDFQTLRASLESEKDGGGSSGTLAGPAWKDFLTEVVDAAEVPRPRVFKAWAELVREKARLRELSALADFVRSSCYLDAADAPAVFQRAQRAFSEFVENAPSAIVRLGSDSIFAPIKNETPWLSKALLLGPGRVVLIGGSPDSGKTLSAQSLGLSVALGLDIWEKFKVDCPGLVVHLNWDQPKDDTNLRYQRLALGLGIVNPAEVLRGLLEVVDDPPFSFSLDDRSAYAEMLAICKEARLVIIDALTGALDPSIDENSPDVGRVLRILGKISEKTGCTILVIHHASKPPLAYKGRAPERDPLAELRGSGSIGGAAGAVFVQKSVKKGAMYSITPGRPPTAARRSLDPFGLRFVDVVDEETGQPIEAVRVIYASDDEVEEVRKKPTKSDDSKEKEAANYLVQRENRVLETIKANPGASGKFIAAKLGGMAKDTVAVCLESLKRKKLAEDEPGPRGARLWRAK